MTIKPAPKAKTEVTNEMREEFISDALESTPPARVPCDVKMTTDFEIGGGSFNRLTNTINQSEIDEGTGIIYFNFKGKKRRMSIHSAAVGAVTDL